MTRLFTIEDPTLRTSSVLVLPRCHRFISVSNIPVICWRKAAMSFLVAKSSSSAICSSTGDPYRVAAISYQ